MLKLKTAPTSEPIDIVQTKLFLRITSNDEDSLILEFMKTARQLAEEYCQSAFITQTWTLWLDRFPCGPEKEWEGWIERPISWVANGKKLIYLPRPPLVSVTHLKTYDDAATATTMSASNYIVDAAGRPGRIVLGTGQVWPVNLRPANGIEIEYIAGYGSSSSVPQQIKTALYMLTGHLYEHRGDGEMSIPLAAMNLLNPYRSNVMGDLNG